MVIRVASPPTSTWRKQVTYYESAEDIMISRDRAIQEVIDHGLADEIGTFLDDLGIWDEYLAQDVLQWLGY